MSAGLALLLVLGWLVPAAAAPPAPLPLELAPPSLQLEVHPPKVALDRPPLVPPAPPPPTLALEEPAWGRLPPWRTGLVKPLPSEPPPGQLACFTSLFGGPQALYDCGRLQFQQGLPSGDFREARLTFENLLRNAPTHPVAPAARYWLGEIVFRRDPLDRVARGELENALRTGLAGELAAHARLGLAWAALLGGEPGRAQAPLEEILRGPTAGLDPTARFLLALAHLFQGRPAEARALLAELAAGRQPSPLAEEVLFWEGQALRELGEREPARQALERFLSAAPPNHPLLIEAIVAAGWLVLEQGGAQEAIQKLLWAEAISPPAGTGLPLIRAGLARAYLGLGDWPRAREKVRQLARDTTQSPLLVPTYLRLADEAARRGLLNEAAEVYQEILDLHPRPPRPVERHATYRQAEVLEELGRLPEASRRYRDLADSGDGAVAQRARYRLGLLALRARQYAPARVEGERLLRDGAEGDLEEGAWLLVAEAAASVGDLGRAAEALRHSLRRFPDSPRSPAARASLAFALERLGEPGEALRLWEAVAASGDRALTGAALLAIADLATRRGDRDRAIEVLGRFLAEFSGDPLAEVAGLTRAVLLLRAERFGEASAQLRALLVRFPLTPRQGEIRRAFGLALFRQQRLEEAHAEFREAGRLSPTGDPEVWHAAGLAALHLGRLAEAEEAFNRARRTAPRPLDLAAEHGLAVVALRQDPERFRLRARSLVDRAPEAPHASRLLYVLAGLAIERGELVEATELTRRLVRQDGGSEYGDDALFRLGTAPGAAMRLVHEAFQELLTRYPESPFREEARYRLAAAALALGERDLAVRSLEAFVAANPDDPRAPQGLALLIETQEALGRKAEAAAAAETFLRRFGAHPLAPSVQLARGRLLLEQREPKAAREALEAALAGDDPTAARAQFLLGELHRGGGETEEAVAAYMATAYLYPETVWAPRGLLGAAEGYLALGRPREAEVVLKRLLARPGLPTDLARRAGQALAAVNERRAQERAGSPEAPADAEQRDRPTP